MTRVLLLLALLCAIAAATENAPLSTPLEHMGFNPRIKWMTFADAKSAASSTLKPVLLAIWLPGDSHTDEFRKIFDDERVERLSNEFHMVSAPWGSDTAVATQWDITPFVYAKQMDGAYTPRVVFISPRGQAQLITNRDLLNYRWYYYHPDSLVRSMQEAIEVMKYGAPLVPPPNWSPPPATEDENAAPAPAPEPKPPGVKHMPHPNDPPPSIGQQIKAKTQLDRKLEMIQKAEKMHKIQEEAKAKEKAAKKDEL